MGIILSDLEINDAGKSKAVLVNEEKNIWRRVLAFKDSVLSIGERKKTCTHCGGPHIFWRCPTRPPYSETQAIIELARLDYDREAKLRNK